MADEITFVGSVDVSTTNFKESFKPGKITIDMVNDAGGGGVQTIGTNHALVQVNSDTADGGVYFIRNLDATNYIEVGRLEGSTFVPFLKLLAGEYSIGRAASSSAVYAKANTGAVKLQYRFYSP